MLDNQLYRIRIGCFKQQLVKKLVKCRFSASKYKFKMECSNLQKLYLMVFLSISFLAYGYILLQEGCSVNDSSLKINRKTLLQSSLNYEKRGFLNVDFRGIGKRETKNFEMRYLHGNIEKGVKNIHINIRSLFNKMGDIKAIVKKENPHIIGISEAELVKDRHNLSSLKIPGYIYLLPKSWETVGKARVIVYVKKTLQYIQVSDLEDAKVQSIWLKAGFKNSKQVYYAHVYREHTNCLGSSLGDQRNILDKLLVQWDLAVAHGSPASPNEVHVTGDMNLDALNGRWLQPDYSLVSLARMVREVCYSLNFNQMVNVITRVQFNSIQNKTAYSCIDHVYSNASHRISAVRVLPCGSSDHDAISFIRYSKVSKPPARTIRKRSYKNFKENDYIKYISDLDFRDVFSFLDVDTATDLLTLKLVNVLNIHAPWIVFQQRKNYCPWVSLETLKIMEERDRLKAEAKSLVFTDGGTVS